jgi:hypothetical protein
MRKKVRDASRGEQTSNAKIPRCEGARSAQCDDRPWIASVALREQQVSTSEWWGEGEAIGIVFQICQRSRRDWARSSHAKKQCKSYGWSPLLVPKYFIALCATRLPLVQGSIFEPPKSRRTRSNFLFISSDVCLRRARGLRYIRDSDTLDREVSPAGVCWGGLVFQRKINADRLVQLPRRERKLDCLLPSE